jgi:hypothetical protein
MKIGYKGFIICFLFFALALASTGCGADNSELAETSSENAEIIDLEMSEENFYEYFDFVEVSDGKWIAINKK